MKKKFILSRILLSFMISCGKKGDPIYKESQRNIIKYTFIKIA